MKQRVNFKCKIASCKKYAKGVIITGKVQGGKITSLEQVILCHNNNIEQENPLYVTIHRIYVSGKQVQECVKGQQVSIYLEGVTQEQIIPMTSFLISRPKDLRLKTDNKSNFSYKKTSIIETTVKGDESSNSSQKSSKQELINKILMKDNSYELNNEDDSINSAEKSYVKNIKLCMNTNGVIAPTELFVLDKIRMALKLPPQRGRELLLRVVDEYKCNRDESIYKDAVSLCLLDGNYITKTERRLLISLQEILNISDLKATEIEEKCKW